MSKVEKIFSRLQIDVTKFARITEESFASEVYLVETRDDQLILKCAHSEIKFWRELKSLGFLQSHILVPNVLAIVEPEPGFNGAMLMKKVAGKPLPASALELPTVKACGQLLAQLHLIPTPGLGFFQKTGFEKVPFENWWSYRRDMIFGAWTETIEKRIEPQTLKRIHAALAHYLDAFVDSSNCYIHCDYRFGNILANNGQITGLIDFESSRTGDPAYDFIKIHESIGNQQNLWQSFLTGYAELKPLPDLEKTIPYYELDLNFGFLQWAVLRNEDALFQERLAKLLSLIDKH